MIALVEGASRQKTPNEIALNILLAGLTIIFLLATVTLQPFAIFADAEQTVVILVALLVCLIPTTIGALLSAIGIAGMDRLVQRNVLAMSGRAVEAAGDCSTLLLDKTGTITFGNRQADAVPPGARRRRAGARRRRAALEPRRRDARGPLDRRARQGALRPPRARARRRRARAVHRADPHERRRLRRPARSARARPTRCAAGSRSRAARFPTSSATTVDCDRGAGRHAARRRRGGARAQPRVLGVIHLKDIVKPGIAERFDELRRMGIRTVMITGDNPLTAAVDRRGGRRRRLPRRGDARRQDGADQARAARRARSSR